jgi:hypothetical protein
MANFHQIFVLQKSLNLFFFQFGIRFDKQAETQQLIIADVLAG